MNKNNKNILIPNQLFINEKEQDIHQIFSSLQIRVKMH